MEILLSFHNDPSIKDATLANIKAHMDADELVRRIGYEDGRGCAVGCTLNKYDHYAYPDELGIPLWVPRLEDFIHENASGKVWPTFAYDLIDAIPVGVGVDTIKKPLLLGIQKRNRDRASLLSIDSKLKEEVLGSIDMVIDCLKADFTSTGAWSAAGAAARSAWSAAWSSAESAESARSAAGAAESAAGAAARYAAGAAESAAWAAESARSAESAAWSSAGAAEIDRIALELLSQLTNLKAA